MTRTAHNNHVTFLSQDATSGEPRSAHILVVDDELMIRRILERILRRAGYHVSLARHGNEALALLQAEQFDVVISDISMPEGDGISLLAAMRNAQVDLPVILVTGVPTAESAMRAVRLGAVGYLNKPVNRDTLLEEVQRAVQLNRMAQLRRSALRLLKDDVEAKERILSEHQRLDRAIASMFMVYQPIVSLAQQTIVGHEALVRCGEPGFANPTQLFETADQLGRLEGVRRQIRSLSVHPFAEAAESTLFLNLHAQDLGDDTVSQSDSPLCNIAERVILEVTERASLDDLENSEQHIEHLRNLGFRIAIDDIGAGYAGLSSFALLQPDIVKLDRSLVQNVERAPLKQKLIHSLTSLCEDLGISVVAEGVETSAERDTLVNLGCDLFQGYLFSAPSRALRTHIPTL